MKRFTIFCFAITIFIGHHAFAQLPAGTEYSHTATVRTKAGKIKIALLDETPLHRDNFIALVRSGFYNGILFHRVIDGFVIQAGDPDTREASATRVYGNNGIGYTIPAEITNNAYHVRGAVGAAREADSENPERASSGSHFYIVQGKPIADSLWNQRNSSLAACPEEVKTLYRKQGGTPRLDGKYTVFGYVVKGMKTVDKITKERTDSYDRPLKDVFIKTITLKSEKKKKK